MAYEDLPIPHSAASIGLRIRAVRRSWHWSQTRLAEALKVDQASISFWERGKIRPSGSAQVAMATLFRTSVEALREGIGFCMPEPPAVPGQDSRRNVSLPMGPGSKVVVVDLGDGSFHPRNLSEAVVGLVEGMRGNRRVWVVLD